MTPIEDFWPRVLGGIMWLFSSMAVALLLILQALLLVGMVVGLIKIIS